MKKLEREFYIRDVNIIARDLIGKLLVHESNQGLTSGYIIETEAYKGPEDKAAHTYNNRRTKRTEIQFHEGGYAYVYMIYGMYYCFNITVNIASRPEAVLIRALEPHEGIEIMKRRRRTESLRNLCNGPGKLCCAMGITKEHYGIDLCGDELYLLDDERPVPEIKTSPRINIDYAEEYVPLEWRYYSGQQ